MCECACCGHGGTPYVIICLIEFFLLLPVRRCVCVCGCVCVCVGVCVFVCLSVILILQRNCFRNPILFMRLVYACMRVSIVRRPTSYQGRGRRFVSCVRGGGVCVCVCVVFRVCVCARARAFVCVCVY